jgi:5-deoxy-glucuronate isomerase
MTLHRPFPGSADEGDAVVITAHEAGWTYCGLRVVELAAGARRELLTGDSEVFVLPLSGGCDVEVAGEGSFSLEGRESVFTRVSDFVYVGRDSTVTLSSAAGAVVAVPSSVCERKLPAKYGAAQDVPVELRGAGPSTRQVVNFGVPGVWDHADRIIGVEVITPPGNWSSYPAHKHDASEPCPLDIEEIYYYRIAGRDQVTPSSLGFGLHRTYTGPEHAAAGLAPLDEFLEVRDHDVVLVPHGYHGPCVAAPGYPMYYLNVMAGPAERGWAFCDDPVHAWVRSSWDVEPTDPRLPLFNATGRLPTEVRNMLNTQQGEPR